MGKLSSLAPLFYEKSEDNTWKMSLGRVAFWVVSLTFTTCSVLVLVTKQVNPQLTGLYLGILSMLFLTTLGLLAYNLGTKFTTPMRSFIELWGKTPPKKDETQ